jgi:hypothetical protein
MKTPLRPATDRHAAAMSRRNFLRGLGACVALPTFGSLLSSKAMAAAAADAQLATTATGAPLRTAFVFFPNGAIPSRWWPAAGSGADFALSPTLAPLEAVRRHVQVLGGLAHLNANPGNDGGGDHARGNGVFLTGVRLNKSATDIRAGISIDQVIANHVGHLTRFPSIELCCDSSRKSADCDSGYSCAYQYNLSWQSPTTPMPPESNPRLAFERLFGAGAHGERAANAQRQMLARKSVLDFVMGDDIMLLAFQTDSTRVATFVLGHDGDNRSFSEIGITEGHHDLSHHQNNPERVEKVAQIDRWYAEQFGRFLARMDAIPDVDGHSILHNSRIVYGSGNADGNRHTHENLPVLLAGEGGGVFHGGRYVQYGAKPLSNLFLNLADSAGVPLDRFGDSTGILGDV